MPLRPVLKRLLKLLFAISCITGTHLAFAANGMTKNAMKSSVSFGFKLQPSYSLASPPDDDDCMDDYPGQIFEEAKRVGQASETQKKIVTMTAQPTPSSDDSVSALLSTEELSGLPVNSERGAPIAAKPVAATVSAESSASAGTNWEITLSDKTLNSAMARWSVQAGWQLLWELPVDYAVEANTKVPGSFEQAVEAIARSMESAEIPMKVIFYRGNKVLRIVQKGVK